MFVWSRSNVFFVCTNNPTYIQATVPVLLLTGLPYHVQPPSWMHACIIQEHCMWLPTYNIVLIMAISNAPFQSHTAKQGNKEEVTTSTGIASNKNHIMQDGTASGNKQCSPANDRCWCLFDESWSVVSTEFIHTATGSKVLFWYTSTTGSFTSA